MHDHFVLTLTTCEKPGATVIHRIGQQCLVYVEEPVSSDIRLTDYLDEVFKFLYVISKDKPKDT